MDACLSFLYQVYRGSREEIYTGVICCKKSKETYKYIKQCFKMDRKRYLCLAFGSDIIPVGCKSEKSFDSSK